MFETSKAGGGRGAAPGTRHPAVELQCLQSPPEHSLTFSFQLPDLTSEHGGGGGGSIVRPEMGEKGWGKTV